MAPSLLQSAFNTFEHFDVDVEKITGHKFVQGYSETLLELQKGFGTIDWSSLDASEARKTMGAMSGNLIGAGLEYVGETAKAGAGTLALAMAGGGGPPGVAVGLVSVAAGVAIDMILDKIAAHLESDPIPMVKGDWVLVDDSGEFRRRRRMQDFEETAFEEFENMTGHDDPRTTGHIHLGVFVGPGGSHGNIKIFDTQDGILRTLSPSNARRVPEEEQERLNGNKVLHHIKGSLEATDSWDQLQTDINSAVGAFVIYQGKLYEIVERNDSDVVIESNGKWLRVSYDELEPAFNSTTANPTTDGKASSYVSIPWGINKGEWVWVSDGQAWYLGVAQAIRGQAVKVIPASNHIGPEYHEASAVRKWNKQPKNSFWGAFLTAVTMGDPTAIETYLPQKYSPESVVTGGGDAQFEFVVPPKESYKSTGAATGYHGHLGDKPVADPENPEKPLRLRGGGGDTPEEGPDYGVYGSTWREASVYGSPVPDEEVKKDEESNNTGKYLIGAACLAGVYLYFR